MVSTRKRTQEQRKQQQQQPDEASASNVVLSTPTETISSSSSITTSTTTDNRKDNADLEDYVCQLLKDAGIVSSIGEKSSSSTTTRSGWCLKEGLIHVLSTDNGMLRPIVEQHGPPKMFTSLSTNCRHDDENNNNKKEQDSNNKEGTVIMNDDAATTTDVTAPKNCFQSLCRIVAGQQLAGAAARAMWNRLLQVTDNDLTPTVVLTLAEQGFEDQLRKPAGLSNAKARAIVALSNAFYKGGKDQQPQGDTEKEQEHSPLLSESFLTDPANNEETIREALLQIKGIGPWSCDMFLMFYLEKPNVIPIGDLGVRKGIQRYKSIKNGKAKGGSLCQKKDLDVMLNAAKPYHPYQSIFSYYMWKVADTPDFYGTTSTGTTAASSSSSTTTTPKKKKAKVSPQQR